ncbi:MAG TPA: hypothetical protein VEC57_15895 [Candidatus Limnocylindrales bacterium]|nr:hypothetical protein [Candidatus Limnocylindrales bacterium]
MRREPLLLCAFSFLLLAIGGPGALAPAAAAMSCSEAIDRSALPFQARVHKATAACELRQATGRECNADKRDRSIEKARAALASRLASSCTDADLASLGFPAECDDDAAPFTSADVAKCIAFTHEAAIDAAIDVEFPGAAEPAGGAAAACQKTVSRSGQAFLTDNLAARQTCLASGTDADCRSEGDATGDAATDEALSAAAAELAAALDRSCGGGDLAALGFPGACDDGDGAPFDSSDLGDCIVTMHDAIARSMLDAQHPRPEPTTTTSTTTTLDTTTTTAGATTTTDTTTTSSTTTTTLPTLDGLTDVIAPYGDADGDGFANNVELAACSNPADAASTPVNDDSLCTNQTIFSDTLGDSWGRTNRQTDPTYHAALNVLIAQNLADCSAYCASHPEIGSQQACLGVWPWSGVPDYGKYTAGHSVEVIFPDESGNNLHATIFLPPDVTCSGSAATCDGVTDAVTCTSSSAKTYPAVAISDGFMGSQRMYYWAGQRLAEQGYVAMTFDVSGQGLSEGRFPNGDSGIASGVGGSVGGGFSRDIGAAMNFLASAANPLRHLIRVDPMVIVNQAPGGPDHLESYVLGLAGHSAGATAAIAYQQSTEAAYPVRARAVVAWSHFDATGTIGNVPIQLQSGDNDNGFIQPPSDDNRCPDMERRYDRLGGDRDLDGNVDFVAHDRQIVMTEAGTHLDWSKVPYAYTPIWDEDVEYHYTLAWFDLYLNGNIRRRMANVSGNVIQSVGRYTDYAECTGGADCFSAEERLKMSHVHLSDIWCSRYHVAGQQSGDMKGGGCRIE